ncbi:hypothetical protein Tco_0650332 [Tanacetum coccineum]
MEQMTTLRDLVDQVIQKKEEEKRITKEQAAKDRSWKIPICYDDDEDNTIAKDLLNMGSHTLQQLKKLSFDKVKELFKTTMKRVNTFTPMESDDTGPKVVAGSLKRDVEQELNQESSKRQKIGEGSEPTKESKDE